MKWKNTKTIYNQRTGVYTLKSVHNKGQTLSIPQFINFAVKESYIRSVDWDSFGNEMSGQTVSGMEACEEIHELGGMMPQKFLEQLLRYEGVHHEKIRKKFEDDKIIFHFPSNCKLDKIKDLLSS